MSVSAEDQARGPLSGVRIVDLSRLVAGNMVTHVLADLGADVIKVEHPERGDDLRRWRVKDVEVFWKTYGRNKRSIALDLKRDEDLEVLRRLLDDRPGDGREFRAGYAGAHGLRAGSAA